MAKNFRTKTFTQRTTPITQAQIERLRETKLKNAKNFKQTKFFSSKGFDRQLRRNIRLNRAKANGKRLDEIIYTIGGSKDQQAILRSVFGEKFSRGPKGEKRFRNTFTSQAQTKRLKRIATQIHKKKFNIKRYVQNHYKYKEIKQYLPEDASVNDIVQSLTRGQFYYENKQLIIKHNKNVQKHGYWDAQYQKEGIKLAEADAKFKNENPEVAKMLAMLEKKRNA